MWASVNGNLQMCKDLLNKGALVGMQDAGGGTALLNAVSMGHIEVCTLLLKNNALANQQNNRCWSPLHVAAENGNVSICSLLLDSNANVNQQTNTGASPLHIAAQNNHINICGLLLENNADVNQKEENGASPLYIAAENGNVPICTLLLDSNSHVNQQKHNGVSPLFKAAQKGLVNVCAVLLSNNACVNQKKSFGVTPLMVASSFGHVEVCKILLRNNAVINLKDEDGDNALFYAIRKKKYNICKLLLNHGSDVNIKENNGKSILEIENATEDKTIISLIKEHQNKIVNKEIEETKKHLKKLQVRKIIDKKRENLAEMENAKARLDKLKQWILEKKEERGNLESQVEFLIRDTNGRITQMTEMKTENNQIYVLFQQQIAESETMINNMLDKISDINQSVEKYTTEIKEIELIIRGYERQKREYEFCNKCFQEGNYEKIIKDFNKECPICFEDMLTPIKIFQCSQGHLLCENCFKKVCESTRVCPFCKRDVVTTPIRNRALEEAIENEVREDIGAGSKN